MATNREAVIGRLLTATPEELAQVEQVFRSAAAKPRDTRLFKMGEAARALNIGRTTLWRMLKKGTLPTVKLIGGGPRVPAWAVQEFAEGCGASAGTAGTQGGAE